ncbi:TRAP transporter small permease [Martelella mediterranea]|uniref:TRAP transporter small permease n=1 Tax=uncultured Martelella sp. TaxID=392331 RepID=UPI000D064CFA|nr:TRAP transporter small permease [uncultured Martelella sp.]
MAEHVPAEHGNEGAHSPRFFWLYRICLVSAGLGGLAAFATALMVSFSVVARMTGFGGLRGDFEAVELVCAACASLFLPLCQFTKGHVMVDIFTDWMPKAGQRRLDGFWTLLFAAGWAIICWRLTHGLATIHAYGDRTMLLGFPVWMIYVPAVFGTGLSAFVAALTGAADLFGRATDETIREAA